MNTSTTNNHTHTHTHTHTPTHPHTHTHTHTHSHTPTHTPTHTHTHTHTPILLKRNSNTLNTADRAAVYLHEGGGRHIVNHFTELEGAGTGSTGTHHLQQAAVQLVNKLAN